MKKILIIAVLLLTSVSSFGQCLSVIRGSSSFPFPPDRYNKYFYLDGSFDINNAFNIDQTEMEPQGIDYDVEAGYRKGFWAYYAYFGEYRKINYVNYGLGIDYYLVESRIFDLAAGANVGAVRTVPDVTHFAYAIRLKPILELTNEVSIYTKVQYQQRPDRALLSDNVPGLVEVYAGVTLKFLE
jgi:hypothetical protein